MTGYTDVYYEDGVKIGSMSYSCVMDDSYNTLSEEYVSRDANDNVTDRRVCEYEYIESFKLSMVKTSYYDGEDLLVSWNTEEYLYYEDTGRLEKIVFIFYDSNGTVTDSYEEKWG